MNAAVCVQVGITLRAFDGRARRSETCGGVGVGNRHHLFTGTRNLGWRRHMLQGRGRFRNWDAQ